MFKAAALLATLSIVPVFVEAAQPLYAQCGGIGWCEFSVDRRLKPCEPQADGM